jgi:hypothetical protein
VLQTLDADKSAASRTRRKASRVLARQSGPVCEVTGGADFNAGTKAVTRFLILVIDGRFGWAKELCSRARPY